MAGSHNVRCSRAPWAAGEPLPCRGTAETVWRNISAQVALVVFLQMDCQPVREGIAAVTPSPAPLPPSHGHGANCLQANVHHSHPSTRADQGERQSQQPPSLRWLCSKHTWIKRKETQNCLLKAADTVHLSSDGTDTTRWGAWGMCRSARAGAAPSAGEREQGRGSPRLVNEHRTQARNYFMLIPALPIPSAALLLSASRLIFFMFSHEQRT